MSCTLSGVVRRDRWALLVVNDFTERSRLPKRETNFRSFPPNSVSTLLRPSLNALTIDFLRFAAHLSCALLRALRIGYLCSEKIYRFPLKCIFTHPFPSPFQFSHTPPRRTPSHPIPSDLIPPHLRHSGSHSDTLRRVSEYMLARRPKRSSGHTGLCAARCVPSHILKEGRLVARSQVSSIKRPSLI